MKISPQWIRDFVDLPVDNQRLAENLTAAGIAVEGVIGSGADTVFEMEIGTNRPDAMNHYGVAREAAAIYDLPLKALEAKIPAGAKAHSTSTESDAALKRRSSTVHDAAGAEPSAAKAASSLPSGGAAGSRALSKHSFSSKRSSGSEHSSGTTEVVPFPNTPFPN